MSQFVDILSDRSIEILDQALSDLNTVERGLNNREQSLQELEFSYDENRKEIASSNGLHSNLKKTTQDLMISLCTYAHDIELGTSRARLEKLMGSVRLEKIETTVGNQIVKLEPIGRLEEFKHRDFQRSGTLTLSSLWVLSIGASAKIKVIMVAQINLNVARGLEKLEISASSPVYLLNTDLSPSTAFKKIPVKEGRRREAKEALSKNLDQILSRNSINLPDISIPEVGNISGFYCCILTTHLVVFSRQLEKRKIQKPYMNRLPNYWDEAVRLDKAHIEPLLKRKVQERGVTVTSIKFGANGISVNVFKHDSRRASHVKVETNVWLEFNALVQHDRPAELFLDVYLIGGRYGYKIKRCWPKCC